MPMNGAAVCELAAHRVDHARPAAEQVRDREQAREQRDAPTEAASLSRRDSRDRVERAHRVPALRQDRVGRDDPIAGLDPDSQRQRAGTRPCANRTSSRRSAGRRPATSPGLTRQTTRRARMPTTWRNTVVLSVVVEPHLGSARSPLRSPACTRAGTARLVQHSGHAARDRRAVDVHIQRRQKDADLLPLPHGRVRSRRTNPLHDAVGRRHDERLIGGQHAFGVAEEEREHAHRAGAQAAPTSARLIRHQPAASPMAPRTKGHPARSNPINCTPRLYRRPRPCAKSRWRRREVRWRAGPRTRRSGRDAAGARR